jgi:hypothetical protein
VRKQHGRTQLVFLDHGLYTRLTPNFRCFPLSLPPLSLLTRRSRGYAEFWLGGFLRDSTRVTSAIERLGLGAALQGAGVAVLSAVVTHQMSWYGDGGGGGGGLTWSDAGNR